MSIPTNGVLGVDLTAKVTGTGTSYDQGNDFVLGTLVEATDGQQYVYVHASAAITQYDAVGVDENFEAAPLTAAMAGDGWMVGVAQVAFSDNDFGWVAIRGHNLSCNLLTLCAADVGLRTSGTAGKLDDATSGTALRGIVAVSANTTTATAAFEVLLTYPRSATF